MIRPAQAADRAQAEQLAADYLGASGLDVLRTALNGTEGFVFVAEESLRIVGVCFAVPRRGRELQLGGIAVAAKWMRRGIGSELLTALDHAAASAGWKSISVGSAGGYVDRFYAKNRYVPIGRFESEDGGGLVFEKRVSPMFSGGDGI